MSGVDRVRLVGAYNKNVNVDSTTDAFSSIGYEHHEVHEGDAFTVVTTAALQDTDTLSIGFKTPASTKLIHMVMEYSTLLGGTMAMLEGPTWTTNTGTATPVFNRNRTSSTTSGLREDKSATPAWTANAVLVDPTITDAGDIINYQVAYAVRNRFSGEGRDALEFVLASDTTYCYLFTAIGNSNSGTISLHWYEHTSSN